MDSRTSNSYGPIAATDLEKGEGDQIEEPELTENDLTPEEARHHVLAAASTPLIRTEKIIVCLLVVLFVMVEAYFVGVSFREWLEKQHHMNSTNIVDFVTPLPLQVPLVVVDGVKENFATPEPFEDFEGGLNTGSTAREFETVAKLSPRGKSYRLNPQLTVPMKLWQQETVADESQF